MLPYYHRSVNTFIHTYYRTRGIVSLYCHRSVNIHSHILYTGGGGQCYSTVIGLLTFNHTYYTTRGTVLLYCHRSVNIQSPGIQDEGGNVTCSLLICMYTQPWDPRRKGIEEDNVVLLP